MIVVTTLFFVADRQWERAQLATLFNRHGMVLTILLWVVSFRLLLVLI